MHPSTFADMRLWLLAIPQKFYQVQKENEICHWDGGSNAHRFTNKKWFFLLQPSSEHITQVSGATAKAKGLGVVFFCVPKSDLIIPLYPSYYAPDFPQNTISSDAMKLYNNFRKVTTEALESIQIVDEVGTKGYIRVDQEKVGKELLEYIKLDIMSLPEVLNTTDGHDSTITLGDKIKMPVFTSSAPLTIPTKLVPTPLPQSTISPPNAHHAFIPDLDKINYLILHLCLKHVSDSKLDKMCKLQTIQGLPKLWSTRMMTCGKDFYICALASMNEIPKGITTHTLTLQPCELIHMDFSLSMLYQFEDLLVF